MATFLCPQGGRCGQIQLCNVTLLLITLTRAPLGDLVFSRAREVKHANKTSSSNSVATVKLTFSRYIRASRCRCSCKFFPDHRLSKVNFGKKL